MLDIEDVLLEVDVDVASATAETATPRNRSLFLVVATVVTAYGGAVDKRQISFDDPVLPDTK